MRRPPVPLFVDDGGASQLPVVLLHSVGGDATHWSGLLPMLRRRRRALAVEWTGHGRSPAPSGYVFTMDGLAADLHAALAQRGVRRHVLVAHSGGADVALAYADAHPEAVAGLLLVDPVGDLAQLPTDQQAALVHSLETDYEQAVAEHYEGMLLGAREDTRARVLGSLATTPRATVRGLIAAELAFDPLAALRRVQCPWRVLVAAPLHASPLALHVLDPSLPHLHVPGTSHWIHLDLPEAIRNHLGCLLASVAAAEAERAGAPQLLAAGQR